MLKFLLSNKKIVGTVVDLLPVYKVNPDHSNQYVTTLYYDILIHNENIQVGRCDLRVGHNEELYYLGNIGYTVFMEHRGNRYAYYACLLLLDLAYSKYEMNRLIITCNPDNIASKKTLERLKGNYLGIENVPEDHCCYRMNEKVKCIFEYRLPLF